MSLWRLPEILTIQLKRFSFRNLLWRDKIDQKVNFPIEYVPFFLLLSACFFLRFGTTNYPFLFLYKATRPIALLVD